jgi:hypothetical protein
MQSRKHERRKHELKEYGPAGYALSHAGTFRFFVFRAFVIVLVSLFFVLFVFALRALCGWSCFQATLAGRAPSPLNKRVAKVRS